ncbi:MULTISPECIES: response regulator transcription factor [Pseudomonas]|uniref:LuxR family transcriptional regulator n=1 Tax=Pseudomonas syringae pv. spinaceae TaxID=264459 RepID=A0A0Q0CKG3_PSESX|nr:MULTISPECIES: helix-turn-helix transcriptional regulator [Pseudomonas]KPZ09229.1 LuxR family transcriptional regulator [Pseudomonas syringae pv. spinaceae]MBD8599519.1 helix-turn-helix transcriptional regulator [Pseudomonas sp. CFBP 8772]MBF9247065.1 helix-turn-helix transcriptional regulator [Pseudomonas syringae pv. tomato]MBW8023025.1 LuxR family transcriptional regulator [Pseudomonas syringae pv. tomato]
MAPSFPEIAWHRSVGLLIDSIDRPGFWQAVVGRISDVLHFDNWVALLFQEGRPHLLAESSAPGGGPDPLFQDYLKGIYPIDPFYGVNCETPRSGLIQLRDVAPDCFEDTEYYQRYFHLNIVADEVQFNCQLDSNRLVCLSFGSHRSYTDEEMGALAMIQPWVISLMRQRVAYEAQERVEVPATDGLDGLRAALTAREFDICQLMLSGHSSKGIADRLAISVDTVKTHRRHIYSKLNIKTQSELFASFLISA